jgi:hypothetical protein
MLDVGILGTRKCVKLKLRDLFIAIKIKINKDERRIKK